MSDIFPIPQISGSISGGEPIKGSLSTPGGLSGGLSRETRKRDYIEDIYNKPSVNEVILVGNKTFADLGLTAITPQEIDDIIYGGN